MPPQPPSTLSLASWNCASINPPGRAHFLHDPDSPLGKADVVFLQELRLSTAESLPHLNPLLHLHRPYAPLPHLGVLTDDAGIIIRHTSWVLETISTSPRSVYIRVRIPDTEPAVGNDVRVLHLWSVHAPPADNEYRNFFTTDQLDLLRVDPSTLPHGEAAFLGGDWNAVPSPVLDTFPRLPSFRAFPLAAFQRALLADTFRTLHPSAASFTRHHVVNGTLLSSRRLDAIWCSDFLLPSLCSVAHHPSPSDHAVVLTRIRLSSPREDLGPGTWRLHRDVHRRQGFADRFRRFLEQFPNRIGASPIPLWFALKERLRTAAFHLSIDISRDLALAQRPRLALLEKLERIDIRQGPVSRANFLSTLADLRTLVIDLAEAVVDMYQSRRDDNMFRPSTWIIPHLESRAFAPTPAIVDDEGVHSDTQDKLKAIHRFYSALFTPAPTTALTDAAAAQLLSTIPTYQRINGPTRHALERPFTSAELQTAMDHAVDSSAPGLDGLSYSALRTLGPEYLARLCQLGNALLSGHHLPEGRPTLRGVLLPKDGDLSRLSNYRPISIADAEFRLLGRAMSNRLQPAALQVTSASQTGFVVGRHSATNLVTLYLIQHAVSAGVLTGPVWVLNLDQQKAYDRVRRPWLDAVLSAYGFGPRFRTYVQELYRHPSICQTLQGHLTDPIPLKCGLLQGDPMSCLLYNLSLQPLLDYAFANEAGVRLTWDPSHPLLVSSLAFADDILMLLRDARSRDHFRHALDLYSLASNARVNSDKSSAFCFTPPPSGPTAAHPLTNADIPFPALAGSLEEVVHLGYPFRLDGGIPTRTLATRLQTIQTKTNLLASAHTDLLGRARICNSFLLSRLWHSIRLCPIPVHLQRQVEVILLPFLFFGRRNWLRRAYVFSPRSIGGLGVINSLDMADALFGQVLARLLHSDDAIGHQFCHALHRHLWSEYRAVPAHFILRSGSPWHRMRRRIVAQSSFLSRAVFTLCRLNLSVSPDWDEISVHELLSLPWFHDMYGYTWPTLPGYARWAWEREGLRSWADILWYNNSRCVRPHPHDPTLPIVPPSASGVSNNYVPRRGWPDTALDYSRAAGLHIKRHWNDMWASLHPPIRAKLSLVPRLFGVHPDNSNSRLNSRPHDRPFDIDSASLHFPWRWATLCGKPLREYTVRSARTFLSPVEAIQPDWSFPSSPAEWHEAWVSLHSGFPLSSAAISDVFLFLHRRPWLAQKPRRQICVPDDYEDIDLSRTMDATDLNDPSLALTEHPDSSVDPTSRPSLALDSPEPDPSPPGTHDGEDTAANEPDDYERDQTFGVAHCMLCFETRDSAAHGFVECPVVQAHAWRPTQATLWRLLDSHAGPPVPTTLRDVVLGWPDLRLSRPLRSRLLLWRNAILHLLSRLRHEAIAAGLRSDTEPVLNLAGFHQRLAGILASNLVAHHDRCTEATRPKFLRRWITGGSFLRPTASGLGFSEPFQPNNRPPQPEGHSRGGT